VPGEIKFPLYQQGLLIGIITHVPIERQRVLLYKNGEVNPRLCALEVDLYQRPAGMYIGFLKRDEPVVETFTNVKDGEKRVAELEATKDEAVDFVVVNTLK
jgi:hypothetical protein